MTQPAKPNEFNPETAVYTPPQSAIYARQAIEEARANKTKGIGIGIPTLDDYFGRLRPGQVAGIVAQTSHYKSGTLHCIERLAAQQLEREGRLNEVLVHISVEECVEEQMFLQLARESGEVVYNLAQGSVQDWGRLEAAVMRVGTIPIYRIGDSLARAEDMPNLYMSNIIRSLRYLASYLAERGLIIAGLFFDYLQAFPIDPEVRAEKMTDQRRLQVRSDVFRLRQAAAYFQCPAWVAIQAKQKLDGAPGPNMLLPGVYDGEETSSIAQRLDRVLTQWMPKQTHTVGTYIEHKGFGFTVEESMLWMRVAKQRGGLPAGRIFCMEVDFQANEITPSSSVNFLPESRIANLP